MDVRPNKFNSNKKKAGNVAKATSVILGIDNQLVEVESTRVEVLCKKFAEIARSMGETNDEEEYAKEMEENIMEAYKKVEERQQKKKQNG